MKIKELTLRNFRRFRQSSIPFAEGINVVKGPNESGKSTMVQALLAAFFWKVEATRKEVRDSVTWGEKDGFVLEMEGDASGQPFQLIKDFSSKRATLVWGSSETSDQQEIEESIKEWLGLGSEAAYRSTAGIRHDEGVEREPAIGCNGFRIREWSPRGRELAEPGPDRTLTWNARARQESGSDRQVRRGYRGIAGQAGGAVSCRGGQKGFQAPP
jgi:hypothetical protein